VTSKTDMFLGVIAVAMLTIAIVQIGVIVAAGMLARRVARLAAQVEREMKPLFAHVNAIGRDAARTVSLAAAQVERADTLFSDLAVRIDQTLNSVQTTLGAPAREARALLSALRAALQAIRDLRQNARGRQGRGEDEEALFI
jgi:hypothetical protein